MRDCGYIQKDATHSYHKFNYVSAGAILEKVNESLVRNGLYHLLQTRDHLNRDCRD